MQACCVTCRFHVVCCLILCSAAMPSVRGSVQPTTHDACAVCAQVRASSHAESDGVTQRNPSGIGQAGGQSDHTSSPQPLQTARPTGQLLSASILLDIHGATNLNLWCNKTWLCVSKWPDRMFWWCHSQLGLHLSIDEARIRLRHIGNQNALATVFVCLRSHVCIGLLPFSIMACWHAFACCQVPLAMGITDAMFR